MRTKGFYRWLPGITVAYFALGFINITLATSALICMILPFILAARHHRKTWCQSVCPRAAFLNLIGRFGTRRPAPGGMTRPGAQRTVLMYFCMNILFATMSSIMVATGRMDMIDRVRFLMAFQIPWSLPQLWAIPGLPDWLVHVSYRFYSVMWTSTVVGTVLAVLYRPRTWCAVCPVSSMTGNMIR